MSKRKTVIRFFTIADYEEEEIWLRSQHQKGWRLARMVPPCFFVFEPCQPADMVYRLDYKNNAENSDYFQLFRDYGWEYIGRCVGWLYFRKSPSAMEAQQDMEIFSDNESRLQMIDHVIKTRLLPILVVFLCCVLPNLFKGIPADDAFAMGATVFLFTMALLDLYLVIYCGLKLRKLRKRYTSE